MANKAKCFEFIYYVVINKMADDVNLGDAANLLI